MKHFIQFGAVSIWCIFSSGCVSTTTNHTESNNLEHFYLEQYVEDTTREINYNLNNDRQGAKQARMDAQRNWNNYVRYRAVNVRLQSNATERE